MLRYCGINYRVDENTGCWIVTSHKTNKAGYVYINRVFLKGYAHRVIYKDSIGMIKPGGKVKHTCNNKICLNPSHLYIQGED